MKKTFIALLIILVLLESLSVVKGEDGSGILLPMSKDGKWGYVDSNGKVVIDYQYEVFTKDFILYPFVNGVALVDGNKFINSKNEKVDLSSKQVEDYQNSVRTTIPAIYKDGRLAQPAEDIDDPTYDHARRIGAVDVRYKLADNIKYSSHTNYDWDNGSIYQYLTIGGKLLSIFDSDGRELVEILKIIAYPDIKLLGIAGKSYLDGTIRMRYYDFTGKIIWDDFDTIKQTQYFAGAALLKIDGKVKGKFDGSIIPTEKDGIVYVSLQPLFSSMNIGYSLVPNSGGTSELTVGKHTYLIRNGSDLVTEELKTIKLEGPASNGITLNVPISFIENITKYKIRWDSYNRILSTYSPDTIFVKLNNKELIFDQYPIIYDGRTLVPLRGIFEGLGMTVKWDEKTKKATGIKDNKVITIQINSKTAYIDNKAILLDVPPMVVNGRTLVPVRFIAESTGYKVDWDNSTREVLVSSPQ